MKMSKQSHDRTIAFMMTRLFTFSETSYIHSVCKSKQKRAVEKRREGERRVVLSPLLFPAAAHITEWQKQVSCLSSICRGIQTLLAYRESVQTARPSPGATRQSVQASALSYLDASALIHKDESNGLNTSFLQLTALKRKQIHSQGFEVTKIFFLFIV